MVLYQWEREGTIAFNYPDHTALKMLLEDGFNLVAIWEGKTTKAPAHQTNAHNPIVGDVIETKHGRRVELRKVLKQFYNHVDKDGNPYEVVKVQCSFGLSQTEFETHQENRSLAEKVLMEFSKQLLRDKMLKVDVSIQTDVGQFLVRATSAMISPKAVLNDSKTLMEQINEAEADNSQTPQSNESNES